LNIIFFAQMRITHRLVLFLPSELGATPAAHAPGPATTSKSAFKLFFLIFLVLLDSQDEDDDAGGGKDDMLFDAGDDSGVLRLLDDL